MTDKQKSPAKAPTKRLLRQQIVIGPATSLIMAPPPKPSPGQSVEDFVANDGVIERLPSVWDKVA